MQKIRVKEKKPGSISVFITKLGTKCSIGRVARFAWGEANRRGLSLGSCIQTMEQRQMVTKKKGICFFLVGTLFGQSCRLLFFPRWYSLVTKSYFWRHYSVTEGYFLWHHIVVTVTYDDHRVTENLFSVTPSSCHY